MKGTRVQMDEEDVDQLRLQMFLSNGGGTKVDDDAVDTRTFRKRLLIPPNSHFMMGWDWSTIMFLLFTAIVTPFEVAFVNTDLNNPLFWINRVVDLFFLSDMIVTFLLPYRDPTTNGWVTDHKKIAIRYLKFWFWIDIVSILPFDILGVVLDANEVQQLKALRLLRLMRLAKMLRLLRMSRISLRWAPLIPIRYSVMSLVKFIVSMILSAHWIACLLGIIPSLEGTEETMNWHIGYFNKSLNYELNSYNIWTIYLGGFYLASMTLTTIGYGDVLPKTDVERGVMLLIMIMGGGFYAFAIGNVFSIVSSMDPLTSEFHETMDDLNSFMDDVGLPLPLRKRVRKYFHFSLYHKRAMNNAEMLKYLTPSLKAVTAYVANKEWIDQLPFLQGASLQEERDMLVALGELFKLRACGSAERLFNKGENLKYIFVVERGAVLLHTTPSLKDHGTVKEQKISVHLYVQETVDKLIRDELSTGTCFGHEVVYSMADEAIATYNATTLTYAELHYIEKDDFLQTLRKFPEAYKRLKVLAVRREWAKNKVIPNTSAQVARDRIDANQLETEVSTMTTELETLKRTIREKDARVRKLIES